LSQNRRTKARNDISGQQTQLDRGGASLHVSQRYRDQHSSAKAENGRPAPAVMLASETEGDYRVAVTLAR
jgi:hypothetical protein